jgi:DNA-binding NarL/FixJ family response regulator
MNGLLFFDGKQVPEDSGGSDVRCGLSSGSTRQLVCGQAAAMTALKLLVVEGHPITRLGLALMASEQPDLQVVGATDSAAAAIRLVTAFQPDVVTVDVSLPDRAGLDLARELRDRFDNLGIVVLTALGDDDVLFRALETGVSAFVSKQAGVEEVLGAIRHAGVAALSFSATGLAAALRRRQQQADSRLLSGREREVLAHLMAGKSVPALAAELYISVSTAKTYVARLYDKLGVSNRSQAVLAAARLGFAGELMGARLPA